MKGMLRCKFSPASNKLLSATMSFDSGAVLSQVRSGGEEASAEAAVAASQADAILDSLQMPRFVAAVPTAVTVVKSSNVSESSNHSTTAAEHSKADIVSGDDESDSDSNANANDVSSNNDSPAAAATAPVAAAPAATA